MAGILTSDMEKELAPAKRENGKKYVRHNLQGQKNKPENIKGIMTIVKVSK